MLYRVSIYGIAITSTLIILILFAYFYIFMIKYMIEYFRKNTFEVIIFGLIMIVLTFSILAGIIDLLTLF